MVVVTYNLGEKLFPQKIQNLESTQENTVNLMTQKLLKYLRVAEERNVTETKISHDHGKMGGKWQASTLESKG